MCVVHNNSYSNTYTWFHHGMRTEAGFISGSSCRYSSRIEKIDYDEGKMLIHFDRWSHRYDEWILWDSNRLRPLEKLALRKEGLKEDEEMSVRVCVCVSPTETV